MKIIISETTKCQKFTTLLQHLTQFTDLINITFSNEGVYFQGLDGSHCCLFECKINKEWFDSYEYVEKNPQTNLGINIKIMYKILNIRKDNQSIEIYTTSKTDKLNVDLISIDDNSSKNFDKFFEMPLFNIDVVNMNIVMDETDVDLVIQSKRMCELMSELILFNQNLTMNFNEEKIKMIASGEIGKMEVRIDLDNVAEYAIGEGIEITESYSINHINMMCNFCKLNTDFVMGFVKEKPMKGTYNLGDDSFISFYLAPRINDDE